MKKLINILLVLVAITALVATADGFRRRLASEKANKKTLAAMLEKNAALKAQIASLKTAAPAPHQISEAEAAAEAKKVEAFNKLSVIAKGPWGSRGTSKFTQDRDKAFAEHKLNDREFGLKYYAALRSDVDTQYGAFYHLQHLTKEQTDALADALFQKQLRYDQADIGKRMGGSNADAQAAKTSADAELAAAAQEALGADLYGQFQLYERQRPAWDYVGNLGSMLSLVDMPLSMEQSARLAGAIANADTSFQNGRTVKMKMTYGGATVDWNAVDAAAADFLTPEQLDFFKNADVSGNGVESRQTMELNSELTKFGFPNVGLGFRRYD